MRAMVTGGTGFVGYHVVRELLKRGHEVRAMVRNASPATPLKQLGASLTLGDLATGTGLDDAMQGVDAVFHVAAHYSLNRRDNQMMHRVNVDGTARVIEAVRRAGGPRMVYTSSTAAVGLRADHQPADETGFVCSDKVHSVYKQTKVLAEQLVLAAAMDDLDIVVVNPSTPIGAFDVKPTPTGRIVLDTMQGRMPGFVETGLNLVAVEDVAIGHVLAYERGKRGDRYILGHENMTFSDFVKKVAHISGQKVPSWKIPIWVAMAVGFVDDLILSSITGKPPRVPFAGVQLARTPMYFTAEKAVRELGMPQSSVEEAILRAVDWFANSTWNGTGQAVHP